MTCKSAAFSDDAATVGVMQALVTSPPASVPWSPEDDDDGPVAARTANTAMTPTMTATTSGTRLRAAMSGGPAQPGWGRPDIGVRRWLGRQRDLLGRATEAVGEQARTQGELGVAGRPHHLAAEPPHDDVDADVVARRAGLPQDRLHTVPHGLPAAACSRSRQPGGQRRLDRSDLSQRREPA